MRIAGLAYYSFWFLNHVEQALYQARIVVHYDSVSRIWVLRDLVSIENADFLDRYRVVFKLGAFLRLPNISGQKRNLINHSHLCLRSLLPWEVGRLWIIELDRQSKRRLDMFADGLSSLLSEYPHRRVGKLAIVTRQSVLPIEIFNVRNFALWFVTNCAMHNRLGHSRICFRGNFKILEIV